MGEQVAADIGVQEVAFSVAGWSVEPQSLRMHGQEGSVKLEPKVMAVLEYLASRPGQVVSRRELEENIWAGTVVGYDAISNAIIKLRKAFGDDAHHPEIIETIPKTGYRLIAVVETQSGDIESAPDSNTGDAPVRVVSTEVAKVDLPRPATWRVATVSTLVLLVLLTLVSIAFEPWVSKVEPASIERMAFPLPDKPSLAVLPISNMSAALEQEYFVDGITEDLITRLSKLSGLFVVARNSMFTYKGRTVKIREVAEELGVRYVLEGSARLSGDQVRINLQLTDAPSGTHIWAEIYDGVLDDVFELQDQVTRDVVKQLATNLSLKDDEVVPSPQIEYSDAYDLFLRGWSYFRAGGAGNYATSIDYLERAVQEDPQLYRAQAALTAVYWNILTKGWWRESLGIQYYEAFERTRKSLRRSQENPTALTHQVASEWITYYARAKGSRNPQRALQKAEEALVLDSNDPAGYLAKANALLNDGQAREAQRQIRIAMRLDPHYPPEYLVRFALTQFHLDDYQAAVDSLKRALANNSDNSWAWLYLAAAYGLLNQNSEARKALEQSNRLRAEDGWGPVTIVLTANPYFRWPWKRDKLKLGLRSAGVATGGEWYQLISYTDNGKSNVVAGVPLIDAMEAKRLHDRGAVFVYVEATWRSARIPGSHFLEWWGEGWLFNEATLGRVAGLDSEIVIYNWDGNDKFTSQAAALAVSRGFKNVYQFSGGLDAWEAAGYPVERRE